jgi:hypothetical protein
MGCRVVEVEGVTFRSIGVPSSGRCTTSLSGNYVKGGLPLFGSIIIFVDLDGWVVVGDGWVTTCCLRTALE